MKIHHNIIAAIILGLSIVTATLIYATMPQPGRYIHKEKIDDISHDESVFDTATGILYESTIIFNTNIMTWNVLKPSDYIERSKAQTKSPASN